MLTTEQVQFFRDNGYLKIPGALASEEVESLRAASMALVESAPNSQSAPEPKQDFQFGRVKGQSDEVLRRIEYVQGKGEPFLQLLAHPVLLDAVEKIVGEQFVPTFDSMVIKMPGRGVEVPWHRDGGGDNLFFDDPQSGRRFPSVNFDIYLDRADEQTGALWVVPGSNKDAVNRTDEMRRRGEYETVPGAIRVDMEPGDMLLHDTTLYHGSPQTEGSPSIRRVVYYEFRDARFIDAHHRPTPEEEAAGKPIGHKWPEHWTRARLAVLQKALDVRAAAGLDVPYAAHPAEHLRVSPEEAAASSGRVAHPGWDG
jgi:hypothetical protein